MTYSLLEAEPLEFETFKRGKEGWPVITCQVALNSHYVTPPLVLDGIFGPHTEQIAKEVQVASHVSPDGVVGPVTQTAFVQIKCAHAQKGTTPPGLLAGLCNAESNYSWPCVSIENSDKSHDYGPTQINLKPLEKTTARLLVAFNPDAAAHVLAHETRAAYLGFVHVVGNQRAWELAALAHNWPVAAEKLAYNERAWLEKPFAFLANTPYKTGLEYVQHYIRVATEQVTTWTPV